MRLEWWEGRNGRPSDDPEVTLVALWVDVHRYQTVRTCLELPEWRGFCLLGRYRDYGGADDGSREYRENWRVYSATNFAFDGRFRKVIADLPGRGVIVNLSTVRYSEWD